MKDRWALVTLLGGAALLQGAAAAPPVPGGDRVLLDAPGGGWVATVRADAQIAVLEEMPGWRRVRVEGWIPAAPPSPSTGAVVGVVLRGSLPAGDWAATPGGAMVVRLVADVEVLERDLAAESAACRARGREIAERIAELRGQYVRALGSDDNFRAAANRNDDLKGAIAAAEKERGQILRDCRAAVDAAVDRRSVARSIADAAGGFLFRDLPPGRYRVVALDAAGDPPRAWSYEGRVEGAGEIILDPRRDRSAADPFADLR